MKPLCIYHANCNDGFGSALVLWEYFGKNQIDFWRGYYNSDKLPNVQGRDVYIVDFSYPPEIMKQLQDQARRIIWLDHHSQAIKNMEGFEWSAESINGSSLDENLSGVGLIYQHLYGKMEMPKLYQLIQDWDTWKFRFPETRAAHFALHSYNQEFEEWIQFLMNDEKLNELIRDGNALVKSHDKKVADCVRHAFMIEIAGYKVPVVNAPADMASDVGNKLSVGHPFAGIFFDTEFTRNFSIRSQPDGVDVGEVAKLFGGGGHKRSAGFNIKIGRAPLEPNK